MGHPKVTTPLKSDNKCAHGILTGILKQKQYKGIYVKFSWINDKSIEQKQFHTHRKCGKQNLGDYPTTNKTAKHNRSVHPSM